MLGIGSRPIPLRSSWSSILSGLAWPALIPVVAIAGWTASPWAPNEPHPSAPVIFSVLWGIVSILGWRLHRTRVVFAAFSLGALYQSAVLWGGVEHLRAMQIGGSLTFAVLMVVFGFSGDRGVTTPSGIFRLIVLAGGVCLAAWFCLPEQQLLVENLYAPFVGSGSLGSGVVPQSALLISVIAGVLLALLFVEKRGVIESGMIGTLISGQCAIWHGYTSPVAQIWLVGGQLILALSLMEGFYSMAYKDELTGLPGRRALNQLMDQLGGEYAICMVDVDHFKKFNDKYGHDAGDEVLRMVAAQIGQVGGGGKAFRYGGEEFTVVFPGKRCSRAADELERLREKIASRPFVFRAKGRPKERPEEPKPVSRPRRSAPITVSLGLADSSGGSHEPNQVLKEADQQLYRAKDAGRNKLMWAAKRSR